MILSNTVRPLLALLTALVCVGATQAQPVDVALHPQPRAHHAGAYDTATGELIIYGGFTYDNGVKRLGDIWAWNGQGWRYIGDSGVPKIVPAMAYDARRDRILTFGGTGDGDRNDDKLSVLDGDHWQTLSEEPTMARVGAAMVYDTQRDQMVMFGGRNGQVELADTWTFDGTWNQTWLAGPSLRDPTAMAYDSDRGVTVLYGGFRPLAGLGDTWEWDGKGWSMTTDQGPGPRAWPGLAYDSKRHRMVLFSGEDAAGHFYGDTWAYDGKTWTRVATDGPPARIQFVMAYDTKRDRVVLFGGMDANGHYVDDVWEFDGQTWSKR